MTTLHIKHAHIIDPSSQLDAPHDLFIVAGKIAGIGKKPNGFIADQTIDATGWIAIPGLVDLCAKLPQSGYALDASLDTELLAAARGGVTSMVCPPDMQPILDEPGLVQRLKQHAQAKQLIHLYPLGALTLGLKGDELTEMLALTEAGCIGFSHANVPIVNTALLLKTMQYAKTFDYTVWLRPIDGYIGIQGVAHSGPFALNLGLPSIPVMSETIFLHTVFELQRATGTRLHICRLSSKEGVDLVGRAKSEGLPVTCDVGVHHLHLIDTDIGFFNTHAKLTPPLRSTTDRLALSTGLLNGTIDAICSDHTPVLEDEKLLPFKEAKSGATGLELLLSLVIKWAQVHQVNLLQAVEKITHHPAQIARLPAGCLNIGANADICLVDLSKDWTVTPNVLKSKSKHTPFLNHVLPACVEKTIVEGRVVYSRM